MSKYLEKLHANQIRFPEAYATFLQNLFFLVDTLKDEEEIRVEIERGFENYRDCVDYEKLKGITLSITWETKDDFHYLAYHAVIKPKVLLAQLDRYCIK